MVLAYWQSKVINAYEIWKYYGLKKMLYYDFLYMWCFVHIIVATIFIIIAAILILDEENILADTQLRIGPSKVGYFGFLQQFLDTFKFLLKKFITARQLEQHMFFYAGVISFTISIFFWFILPLTPDGDIDTSRLNILFVCSSSILHTYTIIAAGWSSNFKYNFLGSIKSNARLIFYDVPNILVYINASSFTEEFDSLKIMGFQEDNLLFDYKILAMYFILFFIANFAETNKRSFDLTEDEERSVFRFNVKYSSIRFILFFLAEYSFVIFLAIFIINIFFYEYSTNYIGLEWSLKVFYVTFIIIIVKTLIPRHKFDQFIKLSWTCLMFLKFINLFFNIFLNYQM